MRLGRNAVRQAVAFGFSVDVPKRWIVGRNQWGGLHGAFGSNITPWDCRSEVQKAEARNVARREYREELAHAARGARRRRFVAGDECYYEYLVPGVGWTVLPLSEQVIMVERIKDR